MLGCMCCVVGMDRCTRVGRISWKRESKLTKQEKGGSTPEVGCRSVWSELGAKEHGERRCGKRFFSSSALDWKS